MNTSIQNKIDSFVISSNNYFINKNLIEALVEYTLFSQNLLKKEEYELELQNYINKSGSKKKGRKCYFEQFCLEIFRFKKSLGG